MRAIIDSFGKTTLASEEHVGRKFLEGVPWVTMGDQQPTASASDKAPALSGSCGMQ